jgi:hypothetical protein
VNTLIKPKFQANIDIFQLANDRDAIEN